MTEEVHDSVKSSSASRFDTQASVQRQHLCLSGHVGGWLSLKNVG